MKTIKPEIFDEIGNAGLEAGGTEYINKRFGIHDGIKMELQPMAERR